MFLIMWLRQRDPNRVILPDRMILIVRRLLATTLGAETTTALRQSGRAQAHTAIDER
jgi:hypothetical protein